jgi:hypothetical protein
MVRRSSAPLSIVVWTHRILYKIIDFDEFGSERFLMEKHKSGSDATRYSPEFAP